MIVATAGHVDHGKTTLIRALTGVDTDRLPEEKARGMSIDIGFAYADMGGPQPVGFVDVPGHERFLRNMLAGVATVDFALLVVAADDGVMPQTLEHLAIMDLLGVTQGAVALTKTDRVDGDRVAAVTQEIHALLASTSLFAAPVFPTAASSGAGVEALKQHLAAAQRAMTARAASGNFRMALDRCFTLPGAGLVVTGAVLSGVVQPGDTLLLSPAGLPLRVRSIHAQDRPADQASAGMRCALNVAGDVRRADIGRGDWIVSAAVHAPTTRIDVRLRLLPGAAQPLAHWTPVQLHLGAASPSAHVALLENRELQPGASAFAQLVLDRPVAASHGDRFILRTQASQRVIAGGIVIDPMPGSRRVPRPQRLARLNALEHADPSEALAALLAAEPLGTALDDFIRARNLDKSQGADLQTSVAMHVVNTDTGALALRMDRWQALQRQAVELAADWHRHHPDSLGLAETTLASRLHPISLPPLARAAVRAMLEQGALERDGLLLRLPTHRAELAPADSALLAKVVALLKPAGLRPPIVGELASALDLERAVLLAFLDRISHLGYLEKVAPNRFFLPETVSELAQIASRLAQDSSTADFDAAAFRNLSGIGRNLTIEVLEYLDRAGHTRYANGRRRMIP